jgi:hypothetical protein
MKNFLYILIILNLVLKSTTKLQDFVTWSAASNGGTANTADGPNDTEMVDVSKGSESTKNPNMDDLEQCNGSKDKRSKD